MGLTGFPWQLPYPDGTDRPCDGPAAIEWLADRMDYHVTNWRGDDERLRRRPAAFVSYESTSTYTINRAALDTVQFNNVLLDTAQMTDLTARSDRVHFPAANRPALYAVGGTVMGRSAVFPTMVDMRISTNAQYTTSGGVRYPFAERGQTQDRGDQRNEVFSVGGTVLAYTNSSTGSTTDDLYMWLEINSGIEFTVVYAELWAHWLSDAVVS